MEISEQTKKELEAEKQKKFLEWNKKINDLAEQVVDGLKDEQLTLKEFNEVLRISQEKVGNELAKMNLNYVYNSNQDIFKKDEDNK